MNFKGWLLTERQSCLFSRPEHIGAFLNGTIHWIVADSIDFRFEDWSYEPGSPKPPSGNFSAGCAYQRTSAEAGRGMTTTEAADDVVIVNGFINFTSAFLSGKGILEPKSAYPVIRNDWARFAEFNMGNQIVKAAQYKAEREALWQKQA